MSKIDEIVEREFAFVLDHGAYAVPKMITPEQLRALLEEAVEPYRKDAERYRFLRSKRYSQKYPNSEFDHEMHLSFTVSGA